MNTNTVPKEDNKSEEDILQWDVAIKEFAEANGMTAHIQTTLCRDLCMCLVKYLDWVNCPNESCETTDKSFLSQFNEVVRHEGGRFIIGLIIGGEFLVHEAKSGIIVYWLTEYQLELNEETLNKNYFCIGNETNAIKLLEVIAESLADFKMPRKIQYRIMHDITSEQEKLRRAIRKGEYRFNQRQ